MDLPAQASDQQAERRGLRRVAWPDYRTVWRWHFYAGLFCIPFVCWLALTGSVYLFKPQVEAWLDRPYAHLLSPGEARRPPSEEVAAALAAEPGQVLNSYQFTATPDGAAEIAVGRKAEQTRLWVHPRSLAIVKRVPEDARLMMVVFRLHGELYLGDKGSYLMEMAASWAVVMILTGLYLWWPRGRRGLAGVLWPRLGAGGRLFWRDLHAVTAVWVSAFALLLILSGLPWAKSWGGYLEAVRRVVGQAIVRQDWTVGRSGELAQRAALARGSAQGREVARQAEMSAMPDMTRTALGSAGGYGAIDRVLPAVAAQHLPEPIVLTPPLQHGGPWTAVGGGGPKRPGTITLGVDGATGRVISRQGYFAGHAVDEAIGIGVAGHEGVLFGWPNQLLALLTAAGLLVVSGSATVLWWRRRPEGVLGAPAPTAPPAWSWLLAFAIGGLGVLLPLFGASLLAVLSLERALLSRLPRLRRWMGLPKVDHPRSAS